MKCLTLCQPWATLIAQGHKRVENRTWRTAYRGPLAIHAGLKIDPAGFDVARRLGIELPAELPCGAIVAVTHLVDCVPVDYLGDLDPFAVGPWCWMLGMILPLDEPIPYRGQQGLFEADLLQIAAGR